MDTGTPTRGKGMRRRGWLEALAAAFLFATPCAGADIHVSTDPNGAEILSNLPRGPMEAGSTATPASPPAARQAGPRPALPMRQPEAEQDEATSPIGVGADNAPLPQGKSFMAGD